MADRKPASAKPQGVSPARKAVSVVLLVVALIVLAIELRAGLGQSGSFKALAPMLEPATEKEEGEHSGVFKPGTPLSEAKAALSLFPAETVVSDNTHETVYKYTWFSLLRPLTQKPQPVLFLVASKSDPPTARNCYTESDDDKGFFAAGDTQATGDTTPPGGAGGMEMGGMGGMMPPAPDSAGAGQEGGGVSAEQRKSLRPAAEEEPSGEAPPEPSTEPAAPADAAPEPAAAPASETPAP